MSPPVNAVLWMFNIFSDLLRTRYPPDAAMIFPVNKIPISTVIEGRGA
jgi:hypothetical protein